MKSKDLFSSHIGLRDLLITFRKSGRDLNVNEADLAGLLSSAFALSEPITFLILGNEECGKSSFIGRMIDEDGSAFANQTEQPNIYRYGEQCQRFSDDNFEEVSLPNQVLKKINFIEYTLKWSSGELELLQTIHKVSDFIILIVPAINPWDTIIYDIVSDIQVLADRPLAVILSHSDLRTDEENNAFKEYICQSSEKALGKQVPVFQISSLNFSVNELDEKNDLVRFLEWVRTKVEDRETFKNKVAIAEKKLVDTTQRIATSMEITSRVDDSEIENLKILEKIIDLTSDQLVYKLSECLHDDLSELEKSKNFIRSYVQGLFNTVFGPVNYIEKIREILATVTESLNDNSEKIISIFHDIGSQIESCNQLEHKKLIKSLGGNKVLNQNHIQRCERLFVEETNYLIDQISASYKEIFECRELAFTSRKHGIVLVGAIISFIIATNYLSHHSSLNVISLSLVIFSICGISTFTMIKFKKNFINLFDEISGRFKEKLQDVLRDHYRSAGEAFFEPYQEIREKLRFSHDEKVAKMKESKKHVMNAVENAKKILAKS